MSVDNDPRSSRTAVGEPQVPVDTGGPAGYDPDEALVMNSRTSFTNTTLVAHGQNLECQGAYGSCGRILLEDIFILDIL